MTLTTHAETFLSNNSKGSKPWPLVRNTAPSSGSISLLASRCGLLPLQHKQSRSSNTTPRGYLLVEVLRKTALSS